MVTMAYPNQYFGAESETDNRISNNTGKPPESNHNVIVIENNSPMMFYITAIAITAMVIVAAMYLYRK